MRNALLAAVAIGSVFAALSPADAAQGCGPGFHRGPYGRCRPFGGPVAVAPGPYTVGVFYPGRGYWDGGRWWGHRYRWHGGWRYR